MPIYEYRCEACGFQKEFLQRISDAPLKDCPECGKASLAKMVTAAGFQLKGSGWYVTDFKDKGGKPKTTAAKSTDASKKSDEAKSESKSESKSETAKSEPKAGAASA
jgi:putative FmdB family regulatory protein